MSSLHWAKHATLLLLVAQSVSAIDLVGKHGRLDQGSRIVIGNPPERVAADLFGEQLFPGDTSRRLSDSNVVEKSYIVSLKSGSSIAGRHVSHTHEQFRKRAADEDVRYDIRREFHDRNLFYGLSLTLHNDEDIEKLKALPEVKKIWPVTEFLPPTPAGFELVDLSALNNAAFDFPFNQTVTRGADYKIDYNLKQAGIEHLHSRGIKGKGVKLAVLDTGVDYNHPALGGGFGPGKKISFGRSYIDDGVGGPDDPLTTCSSGGHGTHVAGTIIGEDPLGEGFGLLGVAPEVELGMYRIFACFGGTSSDLILAAMLDAADDGADIISLSLGSNSGWAVDNPFEYVITALKEYNIVTIVAQGNAGHMGPYMTGIPGISTDAIAVASTNAARYPTTYKFKDSKGGSFTYGGLWPLTKTYNVYSPLDEGFNIYGCSYQVLEDALRAVNELGWDPEDTILLIRRGGWCGESTNTNMASEYGFRTVLFWAGEVWTNPEGNYFGTVVGPSVSIYVDAVDGPNIYKNLLADPRGYKLIFSSTRFAPIDLEGANFVSNFSSWGASWEVDRQKPDVAAPGHLILSTWPVEGGSYAIISGTSMATPFVAGAYALLKSAYPRLSVDELRSIFASTATPTKWWADDSVIHSALGQGAGLINVWNAYNAGALLNETRIVLGAGATKETRSFTFKNTLGRSKTFTLTHEPAGLNEMVPHPEAPRDLWWSIGWGSKAVYADVAFHSPTTFTLRAGETATVSFTLTAPGTDERYVPSYSGYITLTSGRDVYRATYYGVPYKFAEARELFEQTELQGKVLPALGNYGSDTEPPSVAGPYASYNFEEGRYIEMHYRTWQPFSAWRIDLVHHNTTFRPTIEAFPGVHFDNLTTSDMEVREDWGGVQSLGYFGIDEKSRPINSWVSFFGGLQDPISGQPIPYPTPPGDYRFVIRVLRLGLDASNPGNWDSWLSGIAHVEDEYPN